MSETRSAPAAWNRAEHDRTRRSAFAGCVGTLIEYYDFSLYGYMAVVIAPLFFPGGNLTVSLLSTLAVFGTAYVIRPLGGIVFGFIGDRYGRKKALLSTLVCMGIGSTLMGLLPTYATLGIMAPALLVLVRLFQGFSAGGEVGGSATFIAESTPPHLKATYGAFTPLGSTGGFALAAAVAGAVTVLTTPEQMSAWGWRVPFLLAFPLTLLCLWARTRVKETHVVDPKAKKEMSPVGQVFRRQPRALLQATAISAATNGTAYIGLTYMSIHLIHRLGYPAGQVYWVATMAIGISALLMPLGGYIGDRIGLHRLMVLGLMGYVLLTYPMMSLMGNGLAIAGVAYLVIMLNTVATQVSCYTLLPMLFEQEHRYTGVATGFNLGVILAGGTAPFVAMWMVEKTGNILAPAYFVIVSAAIGLVAIATVSRRLRASYRLAA
ncbi:Proline/betaine transporter [compost metagenome]|jgi:MHS family proline/betaine transporter-like MFS transporter